jgi:protein-S-isoprenylcysteine O-methyltransferase Ste14
MKISYTLEQFKKENPHKNKVHKILAHSYFFYFVSFLVGLFFDFIFPLKIFKDFSFSYIGILFLIFGTILIFWAQKVSHELQKEDINKKTFCRGPYRYTRSPTHLGLFFLMLGFGVVINSFFIVFFSLISFFITKFVFIRRQEKILSEKYGVPYLEYKKLVKF